MTISHTEISLTIQYEETLDEQARKRNTREGLTNITNSAFEFFEILESTARDILTYETLLKQNKYMYRYVLKQLLSNKHLLETFCEKCLKMENNQCTSATEADLEKIQTIDKSSILSPVYERIVRLFVTVTVSQFRKDYLRVIKREKGKALRKKVLEKRATKSSECPNIPFIKKDKSNDKDVSHLKLKAIALQNDMFYKDFKKTELIQLLKAYGKDASMRSNKKQLGETLLNILKDEKCVKMSFPHTMNDELDKSTQSDIKKTNVIPSEPKPSTSGETADTDTELPATEFVISTETISENTKSKATTHVMEKKNTRDRQPKRKGKAPKGRSKRFKKCKNIDKSDSTEDSCGICSKIYKDGQEWICCDSCGIWYHRDCVGLEEEDWVYFSSPDAVFICPMCR